MIAHISNNTTELQAILDAVNALPEAGSGEAPEIVLQEKSVTPTKAVQDVTADSGYDGLSKVTVGAIPNEYIKPSGTRLIVENGSYDVAEKASVNVNVLPSLQHKEITENGWYQADPGYDGLAEVRVDVPIPDGYIKPSGTLEITTNGTHDVTDKASVEVNVPTGGGGGDTGALVTSFLTGTITSIESSTATKLIEYVCRSQTSLKTVNLPNVTTTGTSVFHSCTALTTINMPKLKTPGTYAFSTCSALTELTLPAVTSISNYCCQSCKKLVKVDLKVASSIGASSFASCSVLTALILRRTAGVTTLSNTSSFNSTPIASGTGYIYVPASLVDSYKSASNWSTYAEQFRAIEDYPEICG